MPNNFGDLTCDKGAFSSLLGENMGKNGNKQESVQHVTAIIK